MTSTDEELLRVFERKVLRIIFGPVCVEGEWRIRFNHELYDLYNSAVVTDLIRVKRLQWLGLVYRMDENCPTRRILFSNPVGTRKRGRPKMRWLDLVQGDLENLGIRDWRTKAADRDVY